MFAIGHRYTSGVFSKDLLIGLTLISILQKMAESLLILSDHAEKMQNKFS